MKFSQNRRKFFSFYLSSLALLLLSDGYTFRVQFFSIFKRKASSISKHQNCNSHEKRDYFQVLIIIFRFPRGIKKFYLLIQFFQIDLMSSRRTFIGLFLAFSLFLTPPVGFCKVFFACKKKIYTKHGHQFCFSFFAF